MLFRSGQGSGTSVLSPVAVSNHLPSQSTFSPAPQSGTSSGFNPFNAPRQPVPNFLSSSVSSGSGATQLSQRTTISFLDKGALRATFAPAVVIPEGVNMNEVHETYFPLTKLDVLRYQADNFALYQVPILAPRGDLC